MRKNRPEQLPGEIFSFLHLFGVGFFGFIFPVKVLAVVVYGILPLTTLAHPCAAQVGVYRGSQWRVA